MWQELRNSSINLRKLVLGLVFGSAQFQLLVPLILLFDFFRFSEENIPELPYLISVTAYLVILGLFGGFISIFLLGYKSRIKRFLIGFLFCSLSNFLFPLLGLVSNNAVVPIYSYYLELLAPFVFGVLITTFILPEEDFKPSSKMFIIIPVLLILSFFLSKEYFNAKLEEVPFVETDAIVQVISKEEAISLVKKDQYPNLEDFPGNNLPPKTIKSESSIDGWYLAFITQGSGVPIIEARCFLVDNGRNVIFTGDYEANGEIKNDLSVKNCQ